MDQNVAPNAIPIINQPAMSLNFGRMDSDYTVVDHVLRVGNQDTLSGRVYEILRTISTIELNMTKEDFILVWKTLLLRRAQQIYRIAKQERPENELDIDPTTLVPAPLADLLASLGIFESKVTGHHHHVVPAQRPQVSARNPLPEYYEVNEEKLEEWSRLCGRMQHHYTMKQLPLPEECENRPIVLTRIEETVAQAAHRQRKIRIKAYTNEPTPNDAFIHAVNDTLFVENGEWTAANCSLYMTPSINQNQIVNTYVGGYVLDCNA